MNPERTVESARQPAGTSLLELIPIAEKAYGGSGPRVSERVLWLSHEIEGPDFWMSLNAHMTDDDRHRHSAGGIFVGPSGEKPIGPYTWSQVFVSLDRFMKGFDERAIEFLFRDYHPLGQNDKTRQTMEAVRTLALDKYPRLRRIYWDDYKDSLETPLFWRSIAQDIDRLPQKASSTTFFNKQRPLKGNSEPRYLPTSLQANSVLRSGQTKGISGRRAQFLSYTALSQIIRDAFSQNPREFLLNYSPNSKSESLDREMKAAKSLLVEKILPTKKRPESLKFIKTDELAKTLRDPAFWKQFVDDLDGFFSADNQAYSLNYFLRTFDREKGNSISGKFGDYTHLATAFLKKRPGPMREQLNEPSKKLVDLLMWKFQPAEDTKESVMDARRLSSELFDRDCLYVALQLPDFWEEISQDIECVQGKPSFGAFLRNFSLNNPTADTRLNKKGAARYQRYLQRAYHKPEEFNNLCNEVGVETGKDYSESLSNFFFHHAPESAKELLRNKFPVDFTEEGKNAKIKDAELLQKVKDFLLEINSNPTSEGVIECRNADEVKKIRDKLSSAKRDLNVAYSSSLDGTSLTVRIKERKKFSSDEITAMEPTIIRLRNEGLENKEIATILNIEGHTVEYLVGKLIKSGSLARRR